MADEPNTLKIQKLIGELLRACWKVHKSGNKLPQPVEDIFLKLTWEGRIWEMQTEVSGKVIQDILSEASPDLADAPSRPPKTNAFNEPPPEDQI